MHKMMEEIKMMLEKELESVCKKGEIKTMADLELIDKLTHSLKSVATITAMEGQSEEGSYEGSYGGSYARGRGRNASRDSMGRYSSRGGSYEGSYNGSYDGYSRRNSYDGYSRAEAKAEIADGLRELQSSAKDEQTRQMIEDWMKQLER